jgi:Tfp pilus assembly protein PilV
MRRTALRIRRARHDPSAARGFTLIETCIALLILMVVGLGVASLFLYAIRNTSGAGSRALTLAVAQQQLEELRGATFDNLEATVTAGGGNSKIVTMAGQQFNVQTTVTATPAAPATATMKTVVIDVSARYSGPVAWISVPVRFVTTRATLRAGSYSK